MRHSVAFICLFLYYKSPETGADTFLSSTLPPFTLTKAADAEFAGIEDVPYPVYSLSDANHFHITNWTGGKLNISLNYYDKGRTDIAWADAPAPALHGPLYVIYEKKDGSRYLGETNDLFENVQFNTSAEYGNITSMLFTTEQSLDPAPENVWGGHLTTPPG